MTDDHDHKRLEEQVNLVNLIKLICLCICLRFDGSLCWVIWDRWEIFKRNRKRDQAAKTWSLNNNEMKWN